ncbi:MAG TPA: LysE family transporter [Dehalococcoidia bacterium]|nr:LysE family transporter [Dehalococcoidia bacterium]
MTEGNLLFIVSTAFVVGLSGSLMPGPVLALCISQAARQGFWAGPAIVLGHALTELAMVIALAFGLSHLLEQELVGAIIGLAGGAVLMAMGLSLVRGAGKERLSRTLGSERNPVGGGPILGGVLTSLANPYWVIWWVTIGAAYVLASLHRGTLGLFSFYGGHISADLLWYSLVAFIIATGRRFINDRLYRGLLAACGLFMMGLGIYFAVGGVQTLA